MDEFVECRDCGFVVLSNGDSTPKRVDACPDCGCEIFRTPMPIAP